jgi:hypothetical protein
VGIEVHLSNAGFDGPHVVWTLLPGVNSIEQDELGHERNRAKLTDS